MGKEQENKDYLTKETRSAIAQDLRLMRNMQKRLLEVQSLQTNIMVELLDFEEKIHEKWGRKLGHDVDNAITIRCRKGC